MSIAAVVALPARVPLQGMAIRDLESELLGLAGHIAAAQCRFLQVLAEFGRRDGWAGPGVRSCAHWLSWRAGMSLRTATEHLRVAHALARLPRVTEAFAAGRISYSKVRAITRVLGADDATIAACAAAGSPGSTPCDLPGPTAPTAPTCPPDRYAATVPASPTAATCPADPNAPTDLAPPSAPTDPADPDAATDPTAATDPADPGDQDAAAATAAPAARPTPPESGTPEAAVADRVLLGLALSGTASHVETVVRAVRRRCSSPDDAAAHRSLSWQWDQDGCLVLRGRFTPDEGAALIAAVEALVPPREPVHHPVPEPPEGWRERAVEQEPGPAVDRVAARRADALLALVTGEAGDGDGDGRGGGGAAEPVVARGRAQVVVHVDAGTGTARIDGGPEIPASTAERLACDAGVQLLLDDRTDNRLYLGRRRRLATPAQIAALTARDGARCQFPACSHTRHLQAHHVVPWLRGGRTDIDNLVLVCGFHHRVIHDHGYRIGRLPGRWEFRRPDGSPVPLTGAALTGNVEGLIEIATREGLRIDRGSLTPTWAGERLDPEPILDALLPRRPAVAA